MRTLVSLQMLGPREDQPSHGYWARIVKSTSTRLSNHCCGSVLTQSSQQLTSNFKFKSMTQQQPVGLGSHMHACISGSETSDTYAGIFYKDRSTPQIPPVSGKRRDCGATASSPLPKWTLPARTVSQTDGRGSQKPSTELEMAVMRSYQNEQP